MNIFRYCISSYKDLMNKNEIKKVIPPGLIWGFTVLKKITKWDPLFVREIKFNNSWSILWFQISLSTLVTLHNKYMRSKDVKNIFERFSLMREMIKVSKSLVLLYIKSDSKKRLHICYFIQKQICNQPIRLYCGQSK